MKLLFIDANIFLNFYDFHDEDLVQLGKLVDLIKKKEIKLFLTKQVCNEIKKNRESRLGKAYGKFYESKYFLPMPVFCRHYEEYSDIARMQKIINRAKKNLSRKIWENIKNQELKADIVIKDLIGVSKIIDSDKYLEKAIKRYQFGRPPGKKDKSYGDEINWESLLAEVSDEGEFIIISQDGDYSSAIDGNNLKVCLIDEWASDSKNKKEIFFYKSLSRFFNEHDIKIELLVEKEKDKLIAALITSSTYSTTHEVIMELNKYASFSDDQIKGLATALTGNSQVTDVIKDDDVNKFYQEYLVGKDDLFNLENWVIIKNLIWETEKKSETELEIQEIEKKYEEPQEEPQGQQIDVKDIPF